MEPPALVPTACRLQTPCGCSSCSCSCCSATSAEGKERKCAVDGGVLGVQLGMDASSAHKQQAIDVSIYCKMCWRIHLPRHVMQLQLAAHMQRLILGYCIQNIARKSRATTSTKKASCCNRCLDMLCLRGGTCYTIPDASLRLVAAAAAPCSKAAACSFQLGLV